MGWSEDKREETRDGRRRKVVACAHRLDRVGETKVFQKMIWQTVFDLRFVCTLYVSVWQSNEAQTAKHMQLDDRKLYSESDDDSYI